MRPAPIEPRDPGSTPDGSSDGPVATPHRLVLKVNTNGPDQTISITNNDTTLAFTLQEDQTGIKSALDDIDAAFDQVVAAMGRVGARQARLEGTREGLDELNIRIPETLSQLEDTDLVAAISELTLQRLALEAAAVSASRMFDTSLLNFLRP